MCHIPNDLTVTKMTKCNNDDVWLKFLTWLANKSEMSVLSCGSLNA